MADSETPQSAQPPADPASDSLHAIAPAETLRRTVSLVGALVDECRIQFGDDGVEITAIDPANVAAVGLSVDREAFEAYDADGEILGVDLDRFGDVLSMADRDALVDLALDPETRRLHLNVDGLEYTLALVDPDSIRSSPPREDLAYDAPAEVVIDESGLDRAVSAADMVSDHLALAVDSESETFHVDAEGDTDDVSLSRESDDLVDISPGDACSLFSLDYLRDVTREIPSGTAVTLELGTEEPLVLGYAFADGAGSVEYFVSPRIARR
ncbi:DNA polymerase sliding clamp [Haloarchaeobius salinus]|uniref:DNA polymerase sliding clamp n=1 Tax=Haloarchaeobius salinus TaxID=1198298 RepID=UPI00210B3474|nr:DNA polymerase sliding clamp [Haloarchaeobius salinus]